MAKVPYQFVDELPLRAKDQLRRNFEEIAGALDDVTEQLEGVGPPTAEGCLFIEGDCIQFPQVINDNKIRLWGDSYTLGVRSHTLIFRTGGTTEDLQFVFEKSDGSRIASLFWDAGVSLGLAHIGNGYYGGHPVHGASWASSGHWTHKDSSSAYAFMQHANGETLVNCGGTGNRLRLAVSGAIKMTLAADVTTNDEHYFDSWVRSNSLGTGWFHQAGGRGWYMTANDDFVRGYTDPKVYTNDYIRGGVSAIGNSGGSASFGHVSFIGNQADVAVMQTSGGQTFLQCDSGDTIDLRAGGKTIMTVSDGVNVDLTATNENICMGIPALSGDTMTWGTVSSQIGHTSSSKRLKTNIRNLLEADGADHVGKHSPVFKLRPVRFNPKQHTDEEEGFANGDEMNELFPEGVAGLIAEEVHEVMPDAVNCADGHRVLGGINPERLLAYVIDGVQYLGGTVDDLVERIAVLEDHLQLDKKPL